MSLTAWRSKDEYPAPYVNLNGPKGLSVVHGGPQPNQARPLNSIAAFAGAVYKPPFGLVYKIPNRVPSQHFFSLFPLFLSDGHFPSQASLRQLAISITERLNNAAR